MKPLALRSFAIISAFTLTSCGIFAQKSDRSSRPIALVDGIALSLQAQQKLIPLAKAGDADAATRLAHHFLLVVNDEKQAKYWLQQAAKHGGKREKESYQSFLEVYK